MPDFTPEDWFRYWESPEVQLDLMAEGPSRKFVSMAFSNAIFLADYMSGPTTPHETMVALLSYEWKNREERRLFFLSLVIDRNPAKFAAFYLDFLTKMDYLFEKDGPCTERWNTVLHELGCVASGSNPADVISCPDWIAQGDDAPEKILSLSCEMARSLITGRYGDFLRNLFVEFGGTWVKTHSGIGASLILSGRCAEIVVELVEKHFPEPPNLKTMRFE
jgi:hypothetical protein